MARTWHILSKLLLLIAFTLAFTTWPIPPPVHAHDGDSAHAENGYAIGTDWLTFDKDSDVGDGWGFVNKMNSIDSYFRPSPNLRAAECENTQGPCVNVQEVCFPDAGWMLQWDRNYFGLNPKHGRMRLNRCNGDNGRDVSASCRGIMEMLGSHNWGDPDNATCLDTPWYLSEDHASHVDFLMLEGAYNYT